MQLGELARIRGAALPTPLEEAPRMTRALGGPRVFIKRDDLTGVALGGNKARKLEFLFGDALDKGCDVVITTGGPQSNHCRMTAGFARRIGIECSLVLTGEDSRPRNGNLLLDTLAGADLHFIGGDERAEPYMEEIADGYRKRGRRPYVIPLGGSNPVGMAGYVLAVQEIMAQATEMRVKFDRVFCASGSGGTQGGLIIGGLAYSAGWTVAGVSVSRPAESLRGLVASVANQGAAKLELPFTVQPEQVVVYDQYVGEGYGKLTEGCREAVRLAARTEGIFIDPVYTGKALAGMADLIRRGVVGSDETVLFLHTGGSPALFAYADELINGGPERPRNGRNGRED